MNTSRSGACPPRPGRASFTATRAIRSAILCVALALLAACATRLPTARSTRYDPSFGHRFNPYVTGPNNTNELFVVLCLSGGGTRAAAMSYGVMEELATTWIARPGQPDAGAVRLLDEVDVISGVSGGSFVAGYYGAFGDRLFEDFRRKFLYRDVQGKLLWTALNPVNLARMSSSTFDRIDLATEIYDDELFHGRTFGDLRRRASRPFIMINAANLATGTAIPFTQNTFDFLGANLDPFRISRAVAASSAVPGVFSPVTVRNYCAAPGYELPAWTQVALRSQDRNHERSARAIAQYHTDKAKHPYMHLMDGGIADNTGVGVIEDEFRWGFIRDVMPGSSCACANPMRTLLVISVNAQQRLDVEIDCDEEAPGPITAALRTVFGNVEANTTQTLQRMDHLFQDHEAARLRGEAPDVRAHFVELHLSEIRDPGLRERLLKVETSLTLPRGQVDALIAMGRELLRSDNAFLAFLETLPQPPAVPTGR